MTYEGLEGFVPFPCSSAGGKKKIKIKGYKNIPRYYVRTLRRVEATLRCCGTLGTKEAHGRLQSLSLWCDCCVCADAPAEQMKSWDDWICKSVSTHTHTHIHTHTHTHTHSKNTVLYNFWFSTWCWQKWTQKSKQFSCSSIDSVCLSPGVNHRFLRFSRCFVFVCFLCCLCRIRRLLDKCAAHKKKNRHKRWMSLILSLPQQP